MGRSDVDAPINGVFNGSSVSITFVNNTNDFTAPNTPHGVTPAPNSLILYPNPAREEMTIRYQVTTTGMVEIIVFDEVGRLVRRLVNKQKEVGEHFLSLEMNELEWGTYFVRLISGDFSSTKKLIVIK